MPRLWLKLSGSLPRPTLLGRAVLLVAGCLLFNAVCWIAAGICLTQANGLIGLALLAWTLGLRHGLDADHISAIDNATRQMVSLGRLPLTCGLFFSLGHSTIVIVVNIALAISLDIYDKLDGVGSVGGIIGASVSSSFLFVVACINTYFLVTAIRERRRLKARSAAGLPLDTAPNAIHGGGCLVRITAPILRAVDTPWKLYPVGVLFGLGFDTASSIALLAISAIAVRGPHGEEIAHGRIVVLPFLFTAGMSLVDSLDSILMLYAYAQPELRTAGKWRLWTRKRAVVLGEEEGAERICSVDSNDRVARTDADDSDKDLHLPKDATDAKDTKLPQTDSPRAPDLPDLPGPRASSSKSVLAVDLEQEERSDKAQRMINAKTATMSDLSIALTLLSILVALAISLIQIMGLIGENCAKCSAAAEDPDGGGLAGSWWRAWARANDASGYVGAAIVGCFVVILVVYHAARWWWRKRTPSVGAVALPAGGEV